jgi:orotate phosphoribosyltransferase
LPPTDKDTLDRLLALALERGALKYGDFTLSSGKQSRYYFDGRILSLDPEGAHLIAQALLPRLVGAGVQALGGLTLGADPIVAAVALQSFQEGHPIPGFIVRKEAKGHGMRQGIEGYVLKPKDRVAIVDDTCTTGGSLFQAIAAAEAAGGTVVKVLAVLDRMEGGSEELRRRGYDFEALLAATLQGEIGVA